jgi:hypothetical protein
MKRRFAVFLGCLLSGTSLAGIANAQPCAQCRIDFPADAGAINVHDYGAIGDGRHDDTAALLAAINASGGYTGPNFWQDQPVYLPNGTYLVSAPLLKRYADGRFASGLMLVGESVAATIIRLADHAPGYDNKAVPKPVIFTAARLVDLGGPYGGGKDYPGKGEGNDAYENFIENLTIDVGSANPGAIGIDYLANNIGAIRNVRIRAAGQSGAIGVMMQRKWPGPALLSDVTIDGFDTGIAVANSEYGITATHLALNHQRGVALRNDGNVLSIRDLAIHGTSTAIVNQTAEGMLIIQGGDLGGGSVINRGMLVAAKTTLPAAAQSIPSPPWHVAVAEPPEIPNTPIAEWARPDNVPPGSDATQALRRAFASGAGTIYLPHGTWMITDALEVPASVHHIVGMNSTLKILANRQPGFDRAHGMLRILTSGPPLRIERLAFDNTDMGHQLAVELAGTRSLVLRDIVTAGTDLLDRRETGGAAFIEDVCCGPLHIAGPAPVQAVQLDTEGNGVRIDVHGAPMSILGLKTEGIATALRATDGARVDVVGGLIYLVQDSAAPPPAFITDHSHLVASYAEEALRAGARYQLHLSSSSLNVRAQDLPPRGLGRFAPSLLAN